MVREPALGLAIIVAAVSEHMPLATGTCLGPYGLLSPLAAGGMGDIYTTCDTQLDGSVAITVVKPTLASFTCGRVRKMTRIPPGSALCARADPNPLDYPFGCRMQGGFQCSGVERLTAARRAGSVREEKQS
jgi:hypothetical protein